MLGYIHVMLKHIILLLPAPRKLRSPVAYLLCHISVRDVIFATMVTKINVEYYERKEKRSDGKLSHVSLFTLRAIGNVYLIRASMLIIALGLAAPPL